MSFFGIEAHPLITDLGQIKLAEPPESPSELVSAARQTVNDARREEARFSDSTKLEPELVRRCFTDQTLVELISVRNTIQSTNNSPWFRYLKWALLATLRDVASVRVGWPYQRPAKRRQPKYLETYDRFLRRASWMADDLIGAAERQSGFHGKVVNADARDYPAWGQYQTAKAHGCVSSPPYLNNFDYADATRLELYFWGDITSWSDMCKTVRRDMITATTQQSSIKAAANALDTLATHQPVAETVQCIVDQLKSERLARPRGKEYDRVIPDYFAAMIKIIGNLADSLMPGAPAVLLIGDSAPYGVYIDTPRIICQIAEGFGFSLEKNIMLRHRGARWTKNPRWSGGQNKENVQLSERLVLLRHD